MTWSFPLGCPFDIWLGNGRVISGCVYVASDEDSLTVDFDVLESFGRIARTRGQFRIDTLVHVSHRVPVTTPISENRVTEHRSGMAGDYVGP